MTIALKLAPVWVGGRKHWVVQDGEGRKISAAFHTQTEADERRQTLIEADRKNRAARNRPCMCCKKVFESEGIHNRLCSDCRADSPMTHW